VGIFARITVDGLGSPLMPFTGAVHKARTTAPAEAIPITIKTRDESPGMPQTRSRSWRCESTLGSLRIEVTNRYSRARCYPRRTEVGDDGIRGRKIAEAVIYRVNVNGKNEAHLEIPLRSQIHTRGVVRPDSK
jgi:hypothetical protein